MTTQADIALSPAGQAGSLAGSYGRGLPARLLQRLHLEYPVGRVERVYSEICEALTGVHGLEEVMDTIAAQGKRLLEAKRCSLIVVGDSAVVVDSGTMSTAGDRLGGDRIGDELHKMTDEAYSSGRPVWRVATDGATKLVAFPLHSGGAVIGVLGAVGYRSARAVAALCTASSPSLAGAYHAEQREVVALTSERQRIAGDLHDNVVQSLFAVSLGIEVCRRRAEDDPPFVMERLAELQRQVNTSMSELRRFVYDLRPLCLADLGLVKAIELWVQRLAGDSILRTEVSVHGEQRCLSPALETCIYRAVKEATTNVVKHANADDVSIEIRYERHEVRLVVRDDGCGFEPEKIEPEGTRRIGLRSIEHRVSREGGHVRVESAPGAGTTLEVCLPYGDDRL